MARKLPNLKRRKASREPYKKFLIFAEGKVTEPDYLRALQQKYDRAIIKIEWEAAVGVPETIAKKAIAYAKRLGLAKGAKRPSDSFSERDQVWAMFDRDEHPLYEQSIRQLEFNGIGIARSNPCFELWLLLHIEAYDKPSSRHDIQRRLEELHVHYMRSGGKTADCKTLVASVELAEGRAFRQLKARREESAGELQPPYTTVCELTAAVAKASTESQPAGKA